MTQKMTLAESARRAEMLLAAQAAGATTSTTAPSKPKTTPRSVWRCDPVARKEFFAKRREERKARWEDSKRDTYRFTWKPKPWERAPRTRVLALEGFTPALAHAFANAMGVIRPRGK